MMSRTCASSTTLHRYRRAGLLAAVALGASALASACDAPPSSESSDVTSVTLAEGSHDALALLAFVNEPSTSAALLRAAGVATNATATAITARRDGADATPQTADDAVFATVAALDAVKGVGVATLEKVARYALLQGYGIDRGDHLGVYFTEAQADRTLALVNDATVTELDQDASLDARAAAAIVAARPILSLAKLAKVSRVKTSALRLLRDHADRTRGPATCGAGVACAAGLFCTGGAQGFGRCVDTDVEGAGDPCGPTGLCGAGLVCGGHSDDFVGICSPAWMRDEFVNEGSGSIPDGPTGSTGVSVDVVGLATVPTDAIVRAVIDHPRPEELELVLVNPIETEVVVWKKGAGPIPPSIVAHVPGDEPVNGLWTLTVRDTQQGNVGVVGRFSLELTSRFD